MPPEFVAEISFDDATIVITLKGVLDARTSSCLATVVDTIAHATGGIFDVTGLADTDDSGFDALCRCIGDAQAAGARVSVRGGTGSSTRTKPGRRLGSFPLFDRPTSAN